MIHNYLSGQWERATLQGQGPLKVIMSSREPARLSARGTDSAKRPTSAGNFLVLPPGSLTEDAPVTLVVESLTGTPFSGEAVVDLSLEEGNGTTSHFFRSNPVAGQVQAPVLQLVRSGESISVRPGEGGSSTRGLGGWCAKRRQETGQSMEVSLSRVLVDTSRSMRQLQPQVEALLRFIEDLCLTLETDLPVIERPAVSGASQDGVGAIAPAPAPGRTVVITDLPGVDTDADYLLLCEETVLETMPQARALALSPAAWRQLARQDTAYDHQTMTALDPLLDWLGQAPSTEGRTA